MHLYGLRVRTLAVLIRFALHCYTTMAIPASIFHVLMAMRLSFCFCFGHGLAPYSISYFPVVARIFHQAV